jgi:hypothetical protein
MNEIFYSKRRDCYIVSSCGIEGAWAVFRSEFWAFCDEWKEFRKVSRIWQPRKKVLFGF